MCVGSHDLANLCAVTRFITLDYDGRERFYIANQLRNGSVVIQINGACRWSHVAGAPNVQSSFPLASRRHRIVFSVYKQRAAGHTDFNENLPCACALCTTYTTDYTITQTARAAHPFGCGGAEGHNMC